MSKQTKNYEVYYDGRKVYNLYDSYAKPWKALCSHKSLKQAFWLVGNSIVCPDLVRPEEGGSLRPKRGAKVGITFVDQSYGPDSLKDWPFEFDISEVGNHWKK